MWIAAPRVRRSISTWSSSNAFRSTRCGCKRLVACDSQQTAGQMRSAHRAVQDLARQLGLLGHVAAPRPAEIPTLPMITPSRLLKSCAIPPVSCPNAFIFSDCRSISSVRSRSAVWHSSSWSVASKLVAGLRAIPPRHALARQSHVLRCRLTWASSPTRICRLPAMSLNELATSPISSCDNTLARAATVRWKNAAAPNDVGQPLLDASGSRTRPAAGRWFRR